MMEKWAKKGNKTESVPRNDVAMKWTTYLAIEETERQKKAAKKGQKTEMKYGQIG